MTRGRGAASEAEIRPAPAGGLRRGRYALWGLGGRLPSTQLAARRRGRGNHRARAVWIVWPMFAKTAGRRGRGGGLRARAGQPHALLAVAPAASRPANGPCWATRPAGVARGRGPRPRRGASTCPPSSGALAREESNRASLGRIAHPSRPARPAQLAHASEGRRGRQSRAASSGLAQMYRVWGAPPPLPASHAASQACPGSLPCATIPPPATAIHSPMHFSASLGSIAFRKSMLFLAFSSICVHCVGYPTRMSPGGMITSPQT